MVTKASLLFVAVFCLFSAEYALADESMILGEDHISNQGQKAVQNMDCGEYACLALEFSVNGNICLNDYMNNNSSAAQFSTCMGSVAADFGGQFPAQFYSTIEAARTCNANVMFVDSDNPSTSATRNQDMCNALTRFKVRCDGPIVFPVGDNHTNSVSECIGWSSHSLIIPESPISPVVAPLIPNVTAPLIPNVTAPLIPNVTAPPIPNGTELPVAAPQMPRAIP
jgi:hypothetical protein